MGQLTLERSSSSPQTWAAWRHKKNPSHRPGGFKNQLKKQPDHASTGQCSL